MEQTAAPCPFPTTHRFLKGDACQLEGVPDTSVELVVTSPPYPMIAMWDQAFSEQSAHAAEALEKEDGFAAFEAMHKVLDRAWMEAARVLKPGGFACVNIGDATRSMAGNFALYPNHSRILSAFVHLGFTPLPAIIWRKPTNAPNKFMGSGMLPAGAYVTLEHEYVLILRKGGKRVFKTAEEKNRRAQSALFWEERNQWFSDVWFDLRGTRQWLPEAASRKRSGAFPLELAYRLVCMYSLQGDRVLDPFSGTGTTALAALAASRNSIMVEREEDLARTVSHLDLAAIREGTNQLIAERLVRHRDFLKNWAETPGKNPPGHHNENYDFPVMTRQEKKLFFPWLKECHWSEDKGLEVSYAATQSNSSGGQLQLF